MRYVDGRAFDNLTTSDVGRDAMNRFYYLNIWAVYNFCRGDRVWWMSGRRPHVAHLCIVAVLAVIQQPRVECREDGSDWSTGTVIGGATVECPRIALGRNGIRIWTTRGDGCVSAKLHTAFSTNWRAVL